MEFLKQHGDYSSEKSFKQLTTIKIGGRISHYVEPFAVEDLKVIIAYLKDKHIPFKVIGNGSNLICGQSDYDGVVISLKKFNNIEVNNEQVYVEAGVLVPFLANYVANQGLSGLEFASGIPGNVGGLIYMNAGAYKSSMSDIVEKVLVLKNDELVWLSNKELDFKYRHSIFQDHPHWIVISAYLNFKKKDSKEIFDLMNDRLNRRKLTQPLDMPSAGSCFRNPNEKFAWELIDSIGYRGYKKNDIEVSNKHSNFIVNLGNGTAEDYLSICYEIIDKIQKQYNIKLIMEVEKFNC